MLSNRRKTETEQFDYRVMRGSEIDNDMTKAVNHAVGTIGGQIDQNSSRPIMGGGANGVGGSIMEPNPTATSTAMSTGQTQPPSNFVINVNSQTDGMIIVETDHQAKRFSFYTPQKSYLGSFSALEFIKYVTSRVSGNFLKRVDAYAATVIIEKYVGTIQKVEAPTVRYIINMHNYVESPFMGNVETLIKFYTFVSEFEKSALESELTMLPTVEERTAVRDIFDLMIYTLLTHILKIIAALTNKIVSNKDADPAKAKEIKDSLLMYSVSIMYRLSKFVKSDITKKVEEIDHLNNDLLRIEAIRSNVTSKLDSVQRQIDLQNSRIDFMMRSGISTASANGTTNAVGTVSADVKETPDAGVGAGAGAEEECDESDFSDASGTSNTSNTSGSSSVISSTLDKDDVFTSNPETVRSVDSNLASVISNLNRLERESELMSQTSAINGGANSNGFTEIYGGKQVLTSNSRGQASPTETTASAATSTATSTATSNVVNNTNSASRTTSVSNVSSSVSKSVSSTPQTLEDLLVS